MKDVKIAEIPSIEIDPITLDIIEGALKNARHEMDAVLFRTAMSPVIREQHDEFPMITDPKGRMVVGQFGSYISEMMNSWDDTIEEGDVVLTSDPYKCGGAISHINDWLVLVPIFFEGELVGWSSMFGHQMDAGGPLPGGNAEVWNWRDAIHVSANYPMILAGGLTPENVIEAIGAARPDAVDVSSGVEATPGRKDPDKVKRFLDAVARIGSTGKTRRIF